MKALRVFYGFSKINKVMKKAELQVIFENGNNNPTRNEIAVSKWMIVVYERYQSEEETTDAPFSNRMFTKYGYFIDEKPYLGDIEHVLERNFQADKNHVSEEIREEIRTKLRAAYRLCYPERLLKNIQLRLDL